jgi:hypothetical protein
MKHDFKALSLNIAAGLLTYYVTKFLDSNNQYVFSYLIVTLYIVFIILAVYFHFQNSLDLQRSTSENHELNKKNTGMNSDKPEIFLKIFQTVVKLASQHTDPSPKKIGELIGENPQIVLAYLKEMESQSLVVFVSGGKPADINTPFHVACHDNPWKYVEIKPCTPLH